MQLNANIYSNDAMMLFKQVKTIHDLQETKKNLIYLIMLRQE